MRLIAQIYEQLQKLRAERNEEPRCRLWLSPGDERRLVMDANHRDPLVREGMHVKSVLGIPVVVAGDVPDGQPQIERLTRA